MIGLLIFSEALSTAGLIGCGLILLAIIPPAIIFFALALFFLILIALAHLVLLLLLILVNQPDRDKFYSHPVTAVELVAAVEPVAEPETEFAEVPEPPPEPPVEPAAEGEEAEILIDVATL